MARFIIDAMDIKYFGALFPDGKSEHPVGRVMLKTGKLLRNFLSTGFERTGERIHPRNSGCLLESQTTNHSKNRLTFCPLWSIFDVGI